MVIDTREKRQSALNFLSVTNSILPVADGDTDTGDRQHLLGLYSGISSGVAPTGGPFPHFIRRSNSLSGGMIC